MGNTRKLLLLSLFFYFVGVLFTRPMAFMLGAEAEVKEFFISVLIYASPWAYYWWTSKEKTNIAENIFSVLAMPLSAYSYYSTSSASVDVKSFVIVINIAILYALFIVALFMEVIVNIASRDK